MESMQESVQRIHKHMLHEQYFLTP